LTWGHVGTRCRAARAPEGHTALGLSYAVLGHCCCFRNFKLPIPPQIYNWNVNFPPFVTPTPFSFGMSCSNQSCRATQGFQLFFKCQSLIRPILEDMELRKRAPQTEICTSVPFWLKWHSSPHSISQNEQWKAKPITACGIAIRVLQHCLQVLGKIPTGLQDINPRSRVLAN
jgi:hypothetical protein